MPRTPREKSPVDLYHLVFRGTNKQVIFESRYDYFKYLEYIQKAKEVIDFEIHAYCLMSNHVHLLVKVPFNKLSNISLRINGPYAHFYNLKYCRTGHLFQIRFGSVAITSTQQYKNTVRYIHQNPVHAGFICIDKMHEYNWSSFSKYKNYLVQHEHITDTILVDPDIVIDYFSLENGNAFKTRHNTLSQFFSFHSIVTHECAYENESSRLTDQEAIEIVANKLGHKTEFLKDVQKMDIEERTDFIANLKMLKLSVKQISRLTGIGRNIIQRVNVNR